MIRPVLVALFLCAAHAAAAQPLSDGLDAAGTSIVAPGPTGPDDPAPDDPVPDRDVRSATIQRDGGPTRACTARVIGLRPLSHYDHAQGSGFLAVREGPGSTFAQVGELYLGDSVTVGDRRGNWYAVRCTGGLCTTPLWGDAAPQGWAYGRFLHLSCPG